MNIFQKIWHWVNQYRARKPLSEGHSYFDSGQDRLALSRFRRAQRIDSSNVDIDLNIGIALYALGDYQEALRHFSQSTEQEAKSQLASAWKGIVYKRLKLDKEAEAEFSKVIQLNLRGTYDNLIALGHALNGMGRPLEAVGCFEEAASISDSSYRAWTNHGESLNYAGEHRLAVKSFDLSLGQCSDYCRAWRGKGVALARLELNEQAVECFDKALSLRPHYYGAWSSKSLACARLKSGREAEEASRQAIRLRPEEPEPHVTAGRMWSLLKETDKAIESYETALQKNPNCIEALFGLGRCKFRQNPSYEEVIWPFEKIIELQWDFVQAHYYLGLINDKFNKPELSLKHYQNLFDIQADYNDVRSRYRQALSKISERQGRRKAVIQACEVAIEACNWMTSRHPNNPEIYEIYRIKGDLLLKKNWNDTHEALRQYRTAIDYGDTSSTVWLSKGDLEKRLERYYHASKSYEQATKAEPQCWQAWDNWAWNLLLYVKNRYGGPSNALRKLDAGLRNLEEQKGKDILIGRAKLLHSRGQINHKYLLYYPGAKEDYDYALEQYRMIHNPPFSIRKQYLNVQKDYLELCRKLKEHLSRPEEYEKRLNDAEELLEQLIDSASGESEVVSLRRRFEGFYQLRVDQLVQKNDLQQALFLAETRKNTCLSWMHDKLLGDSRDTLFHLQALLKPGVALIYWYISPLSITTFILKSETPIQVVPNSLGSLRESSLSSEHQLKLKFDRLKEFKAWIERWKLGYEAAYSKKRQTRRTRQAKEQDSLPTEASWKGEMNVHFQELSKILSVAKISREYLDGVQQLILVPHRELHLLPLHVLFSSYVNFPNSRILKSISYLPSIQAAFYQKHHKTSLSDGKLLVVEYSSSQEGGLVSAETEREILASMFGTEHTTQVYGKENATKRKVIELMKQDNDILHFSCHGYHNIARPLQSSLVLAGENAHSGNLTMQSILNESIHHYRLVCLSACETGVTSRNNIIDEFVGLNSAFLAKGSRYVLSTLWPVNSRACAVIMIKFYRELRRRTNKGGMNAEAESLKAVQKWMQKLSNKRLLRLCEKLMSSLPAYSDIWINLQTEADIIRKQDLGLRPFNEPYFWASFILTGVSLDEKYDGDET